MYFARLFLFLSVSLQLPLAAAHWTNDLPGQWDVNRIDKDFYLLIQPEKDWQIYIRKVVKAKGDKLPPFAVRKSQFKKIEKGFGFVGSITESKSSKNIFHHSFTSEDETYTATERVIETDTYFVSILIDTDQTQDLHILKMIPDDPFKKDREPASDTEAGFCPSCMTSQVEKPLVDFLKNVTEELKPVCKADQPDTKNKVNEFAQAWSCFKGLGLGVIGFVRGIYGLLSFFVKHQIDPKYKSAFESSIATTIWKVSRDPTKYMGLAWDAVKSGVAKGIKNFAQCGTEYQTAVICKFIGASLMPGGMLFKYIRKASAARKLASLEQVVVAAVEETPEARLVGAVKNLDSKPKLVAVDGNDITYMARADRDVPTLELNRAKNGEEKIQKALNDDPANGGIRVVEDPQAKLAKEIWGKALADIGKNPTPAVIATSAKKIKDEVLPIMQEALQRQGLKSNIVVTSISSDPWTKMALKKFAEYTDLEIAGSSDLNKIASLKTEYKAALKMAQEAEGLAKKGAFSEAFLEIDLSSNAQLLNLSKRWGLKRLVYSPNLDTFGRMLPEEMKLSMRADNSLARIVFNNETGRHEIHHLKNVVMLERGHRGPMYGEFWGFKSIGDYSISAIFDELPAFHRSLGWIERGFGVLTEAKSKAEAVISESKNLKRIAEAANQAVTEAKAGLANQILDVKTIAPKPTENHWTIKLSWNKDPNKKVILQLPFGKELTQAEIAAAQLEQPHLGHLFPLTRNMKPKDVEATIGAELDRLKVMSQSYIDFADRKIQQYTAQVEAATAAKNKMTERMRRFLRDIRGESENPD